VKTRIVVIGIDAFLLLCLAASGMVITIPLRFMTAHSDMQNRLLDYFDTTTDVLRRQISQIDGLLAEKGKGQHTHVSKYIAGKTRRALAADKQAVSRLYGITLQNKPGDIGETKGGM